MLRLSILPMIGLLSILILLFTARKATSHLTIFFFLFFWSLFYAPFVYLSLHTLMSFLLFNRGLALLYIGVGENGHKLIWVVKEFSLPLENLRSSIILFFILNLYHTLVSVWTRICQHEDIWRFDWVLVHLIAS